MKRLKHLMTPAATLVALAVLGLTVACLYPVREHRGYGQGPERGPEPYRGHEEHRPEYRPI